MTINRKLSKEKAGNSPTKSNSPKKSTGKRITPEELLAGMFVQRPVKKATTQSEEKTVICYTLQGMTKDKDSNGNTLSNDDSSKINKGGLCLAYAKQVSEGGKAFFYIMSDKQNLYNPVDSEHKKNKVKGVDRWQWQLVSPKAFAYYLAFLKTRNEYQLRNAEREFFGD